MLGTLPNGPNAARELTRRHRRDLDRKVGSSKKRIAASARASPLITAKKYAAALENGCPTKAAVARKFEVSRPVVTRHLNLLNLPSVIIDYLDKHKNEPEVISALIEHRLRPLTTTKRERTEKDVVKAFEGLLIKFRLPEL